MKKYLFYIFFFLGLAQSYAQSTRRVSGSVTDSTKTSVGDVTVLLIAATDTLRAVTNTEGVFSFPKIKAETFSIQITALGYHTFRQTYSFGKAKSLDINDIVLKPTAYMLKPVEIKAKPNPVRFMQDTVEYNAAAFRVEEGDNVADLLKQFPGLEVDDQNNVTTMGKNVVKLRVNGQDFFTSDVKEFIAKLPAGIVSKIQVIDDYGDEANFTGIKTGEPSKMLNIVTKPGMNKGKFGGANINGGTNSQLRSTANINLWSGTKQSGASLGYGTQNNGAGTSGNKNASINHRDKLGKNGTLNVNYRFSGNESAYAREQNISTLNTLGNFYTHQISNGENAGNNHNFSSGYSFNNKKIFVNSSFSASYNQNNNLNASFSNQSGVLRQDIRNSSESAGRSPSLNASINLSKALKNKRNSFSANFNFSSNGNRNNQYISTNTLYYDKDTEVLRKDSLLSRNIISHNQNQNATLGFSYHIGLRKPKKDTLASQSLSINYNASIGNSRSDMATYVFNNLDNQARFVDSLSSEVTSLFINQLLGISFNRSNPKMRYSLGMNARPNIMRNHYVHLQRHISNDQFNYSPTLNLSRTFSKGKTLSLNYNGNSNAPSLSQMQPVRNTQNLQNIIVGNPDLKPYFTHRFSSNYNYVHLKSGLTVMTGLSFSATQNEITTNLILLPDTLNSIKQETHYLNTNGTYNASGNYNFNFPIKKNVFSISYNGNIGLSNKAVFINSTRRFNEGVNFSQRFSGNLHLKKFSLSGGANYSYNSNTNVLNSGFIGELYNQSLVSTTFFRSQTYGFNINSALRFKKFFANGNIDYTSTHNSGEFKPGQIRNINRLGMSVSGQLLFLKNYALGINASQQINKGYAANVNPLLINLDLRRSFLKNKALSLYVAGNDLLNQGNSLSRMVSGNSIIDSRSNLVTRVFTFGLSYSLSNFGGQNFTIREQVGSMMMDSSATPLMMAPAGSTILRGTSGNMIIERPGF